MRVNVNGSRSIYATTPAREERRRQVINLRMLGLDLRRDCRAYEPILSRMGVCDICKRYTREGAAGLRDKPSGEAVNPS
ncbi:MAG: hypothetical protein VB140_10375 [Burkholderia sp.]